jgi:flagellar protein FliO/FliZ
MRRGLYLFVGWALVQHSIAFAAEQPFAAPEAAKTVSTSAAGSLAQVTLSLILVLGAVFASAWLVRRLRNFGRPGAGAIQIVADVALGTKERAVLIQVGAQQLLLGVAPGRVNTLHMLAEPVRTDDAQRGGGADELSPSSSSSPRPDFKSILKRSLGL